MDLEPDERRLLGAYRAARTPEPAAIALAFAATLERIEHGPPVVLDVAPRRTSVVWARVSMFAIAAAAVVLIAWRGFAALERMHAPDDIGSSAPFAVDPPGTVEDLREREPAAAQGERPDFDAAMEPSDADVPMRDAAAPREPGKPRPRATGGGLGDELELLRAADAALARGDARGALARLGEHARRFPSGQMVPERLLQQSIALCRVGKRDKSRATVAKLLRGYPSSPLRARASEVCAEVTP